MDSNFMKAMFDILRDDPRVQMKIQKILTDMGSTQRSDTEMAEDENKMVGIGTAASELAEIELTETKRTNRKTLHFFEPLCSLNRYF